jgi:hypothetical protein
MIDPIISIAQAVQSLHTLPKAIVPLKSFFCHV